MPWHDVGQRTDPTLNEKKNRCKSILALKHKVMKSIFFYRLVTYI